jgi:hypothetical protein
VRPFLVEDVDEVIKPGLPLQEVETGWFGGFFLQGEMHALMTAILLGMIRLDAFNANPKPEPPDGKFAQVEQGVGGSEGDAVIDTDVGGQPTLFKKPLQQSKSKGFLGGGRASQAKRKLLA